MIRSSQVFLLALALGAAGVPPARGHDPSKHGPNTPPTKPAGPAVTVELQAEVRGGLAWRFWPDRPMIRARRGESVQVLYRARNLGERPSTGKAIHSILPDGVEGHLDLVECFCFLEATLAPGEERTFPLAFRLRPTLPRTVRRVVLRYEFATEVLDGPVAELAAPPLPGTLEVWANATRADGVRLRVVSVGIEGEAAAGAVGWFQFPTSGDGIPLDSHGGATRLLRGAVPTGTYRALRLQAMASPDIAGEVSTAVLLHSDPVPIGFTVRPGETTTLVLDVAPRNAAGRGYEVHIERPSARPPWPAPASQGVVIHDR